MGGVAKAVGKVVSGVAEAVGDVVEAVAENPIIATAAMAVTGIPLPAAVASVISNPVSAVAISMASTAIQGGDFGDIIKSGAGAALGGAIGGAVGKGVASNFGNVAGKVAASAASGFTNALVQTGDVGTALKSGVMGAALSGVQQGVSAGVEKLKQQFPGQITTGGGQPTADTARNLRPGDRIPTAPSYMTQGGTFETVAPTSPFGTLGTTSFQNLQYSPSIQERILTGASGGIQDLASDALKPTLASALGFGGQPSTQSTGPAPSGGQGGPGVAVTGEGAAINPAAASALAQALRVGDPGAPLFGTEGKGQQQAVWNTASLKFKDEVGG
jgi:hypothetical protein